MKKEVAQVGWQSFLSLCRKSSSDTQLNELLGLLLTPEEQQSVAARVLLTRALLLGEKTQRDISEELGVSIAKITRGSNALKFASASLKEYITESTEER